MGKFCGSPLNYLVHGKLWALSSMQKAVSALVCVLGQRDWDTRNWDSGSGTGGTGTAVLGHAELGQRFWDMRNWDSGSGTVFIV